MDKTIIREQSYSFNIDIRVPLTFEWIHILSIKESQAFTLLVPGSTQEYKELFRF